MESTLGESQDLSDNLTTLSPASFARLARFITAELGIKMPDSKLTMLQSRLLRRVRELRMHSLEEYSKYFFDSSHGEEREHFINAITTNKTDFFREPTILRSSATLCCRNRPSPRSVLVGSRRGLPDAHPAKNPTHWRWCSPCALSTAPVSISRS
jgi:hypothetical protein